MSNPLPLPFSHGFNGEQLQWHWTKFLEMCPSFGVDTTHSEDAQGWWEFWMLGACLESKRGGNP